MPTTVRKRREGESGKYWKIVDTETGKIVGSSESRMGAEISSNIRNRAWREKQRGKRK